jgi:hypothetical protein
MCELSCNLHNHQIVREIGFSTKGQACYPKPSHEALFRREGGDAK